MVEGDIMLPDTPPGNDYNAIIGNNRFGKSYKWENGVVPYVIGKEYNKTEINMIKIGIQMYHDHTCIRFVERTNEKDYIYLKKRGNICSSYMGRQGGPQMVSLGVPKCFKNIAKIIHEFMHALGFFHEHSRTDRDDHIKLIKANIKGDGLDQFSSYSKDEIDDLEAPYDTCSVMHYPETAFSKDNTSKTIVPYVKRRCKMGQRDGFSDIDIRKINTFYKCDDYKQVEEGRPLSDIIILPKTELESNSDHAESSDRNLATLSSQPKSNCRRGWSQFQSSCYRYIGVGVSKQTALLTCRSFPGAHIVTIESAAEQRFVGTMSRSQIWTATTTRRWSRPHAQFPFICEYEYAKY